MVSNPAYGMDTNVFLSPFSYCHSSPNFGLLWRVISPSR